MGFTPEAYRNRPTRAEVSIPNLLNNFAIVKSLIGPDVKVMPMVKANAYGHGIIRISQELVKAGADALGVAYLEEAVFLRASGLTAPIAVMGAINTEQIHDFIANDIEITSSSIDKSRAISEVARQMGKRATVHLKIDTGMERIGVHWYHAERFIQETCGLPNLQVKGVFSHLAKAESDRRQTEEQIRRFEDVLNLMQRKNCLPEQAHLANSAGILNHRASHFNLVRPGIMLYGYDPNGYRPDTVFGDRKLRPVMSLKTKVSFFKFVPAGAGISYNHTHLTPSDTRIVTLPIGFGDGYSRMLSNRGEVLIRGKRCRVVGTVCMDQIMVDIGAEGTAYNGDDVLLFGEMEGESIPLESLCEKAGTLTYELLCNISSRVPRTYLG